MSLTPQQLAARRNIVEPGIHYDLPAEDYHAIEAMSNTGAGHILISPAHYVESRNHDDETKEKTRGTAAHAAILQPVEFRKTYAMGPAGDARTKEFKAAWKYCEESYPGCVILREEEYIKIESIREAVWKHPIASHLLDREGRTESSWIWKDSDTGALCKARIDKLAVNAVIDLKCLRDIRPDEFAKCVYARGYHRQGAVYQHATAALGRPCDLTAFICVENEPPHGVIVYELDEEAIEWGWQDFRRAMEIYARCCESGEWPGFPCEIKKVSLPRWAMRDE